MLCKIEVWIQNFYQPPLWTWFFDVWNPAAEKHTSTGHRRSKQIQTVFHPYEL